MAESMNDFKGQSTAFFSSWLKEKGLEKLKETFESNEIDGDAFILLTPESLKQMVPKQGLLLKFQHHFQQLSNSLSEQGSKDQPTEKVDEVPVSIEPKRRSLTGTLSPDIIREQSKIFGKKRSTPLSSWQKAVNQAAFALTQESPDRMYDRGQLKLDAEEEARKTYVFKKSYGSRSKFDGEDRPAKRAKLSNESRNNEISICSLEVHTITERAREIQKEISRAITLKDFEKCSNLQKAYRQLQANRRKAEAKLTGLQKKQARHLKYVAKKAREVQAESGQSEKAEQQPLDDIRSFSVGRSCSKVSNTVHYDDHGDQSDDTVIVSDEDEEKNFF